MVAMVLPVAATPLSARACILSNVASEKACKQGCCANKACCKTSHERTGLPVQPFAKSGLDQQNLATPPSAVAAVVFDQTAADSLVFSRVEWTPHSLAPLALICIRLI
jgi:hypothetical protein